MKIAHDPLTFETDLLTEVETFLVDRRARRCSPPTVTWYRMELQFLVAFLQEKGIQTVPQVTKNLIREYLVDLGTHRNDGGVNSSWRAMRAFFIWWSKEYSHDNPLTGMDKPRYSNAPVKGASMDQIQAMIDACPRTHEGRRDSIILRALVDTGCRAFEFCNIRVIDVDLETGTVTLPGPNTKSKRPRQAYLGPKTLREVIRWVRMNGLKKTDVLFQSKYGKPLTPSGLRQMVERRALDANVDPVPSPHDFRRACGLSLHRQGVPLNIIKRILGHTNIKVTERYIDVDDTDAFRAYQSGSPGDLLR